MDCPDGAQFSWWPCRFWRNADEPGVLGSGPWTIVMCRTVENNLISAWWRSFSANGTFSVGFLSCGEIAPAHYGLTLSVLPVCLPPLRPLHRPPSPPHSFSLPPTCLLPHGQVVYNGDATGISPLLRDVSIVLVSNFKPRLLRLWLTLAGAEERHFHRFGVSLSHFVLFLFCSLVLLWFIKIQQCKHRKIYFQGLNWSVLYCLYSSLFWVYSIVFWYNTTK